MLPHTGVEAVKTRSGRLLLLFRRNGVRLSNPSCSVLTPAL
jgi:hypothetical protein